MKVKKNKLDLKKLLGSRTAKAGFSNEKDVIKHFNNWKTDVLSQEWLGKMGYDFKDIEFVNAKKVEGHYKADVQVRVIVLIKLKSQEDIQNLQIKLVSNPVGFNQIDKRWVDKYVELWNIPKDITSVLKRFTGEIKPSSKNVKDKRRTNFNEMEMSDRTLLLNFFTKNKILIVSDILKGRGEFSADWTLVILKVKGEIKWVLKSINEVMNIFGNGPVYVTDKGSLKIGRIGMQRKGGDGGRETAKMLQFKINPVELFDN